MTNEVKANVIKGASHARSIAKGFTWRVIATLTTVSLVYKFTGEIGTALELGAFEVIAKILFYYLHERGWNMVKWGRTT